MTILDIDYIYLFKQTSSPPKHIFAPKQEDQYLLKGLFDE